MLASDSPTNLLRISGPLTIFGSLEFSILPICLAISVLPQPGGPKSMMPFTCLQPAERTAHFYNRHSQKNTHYPQSMHLSNAFIMITNINIIETFWWKDAFYEITHQNGKWRQHKPICSTMSGGKTREAKALRKISENSLSRPPMPIFSKFQSGLMIAWRDSLVLALPGEHEDEEKNSEPSYKALHMAMNSVIKVKCDKTHQLK